MRSSNIYHVLKVNWCRQTKKDKKELKKTIDLGKRKEKDNCFKQNFTARNHSLEMENMSAERPVIHELNSEISDLLLQIHKVVTELALRIKEKVMQTAEVLCMLQLLIFVAIFLYVSFYYTFMPSASFITPVYFYYR